MNTDYTKEFKTEDVLSVTTGLLLGDNIRLLDDPKAKVGLLDVLDYTLGKTWRNKWDVKRAMDTARDILAEPLSRLPQEGDKEVRKLDKDTIPAWLDAQKKERGDMISLIKPEKRLSTPTIGQRIKSALRRL